MKIYILLLLLGCKEEFIVPYTCIDEDKIDEQAVCIEIYQPVCGCNAKTYSNTCYAKRAGLISWKDGECI